jgi:hypothetical protein
MFGVTWIHVFGVSARNALNDQSPRLIPHVFPYGEEETCLCSWRFDEWEMDARSKHNNL